MSQHDHPYASASSLRPGNDNGKVRDRAGTNGGMAAIQDRGRPHESPASVAPISVTVSRGSRGAQQRPYPVADSAARSGGGDAVSVTSPTIANVVAGDGCAIGRDERSTKRTPGGGWTGYGGPGGGGEKNGTWHNEPEDSTRRGEHGGGTWFDPPAAATDGSNGNAGAAGGAGEGRPVTRAAAGPATPPPVAEARVRSTVPGEAGARVGDLSTGFFSERGRGDDAGQHEDGFEEAGAEEAREDVAKKLDFHTVFD